MNSHIQPICISDIDVEILETNLLIQDEIRESQTQDSENLVYNPNQTTPNERTRICEPSEMCIHANAIEKSGCLRVSLSDNRCCSNNSKLSLPIPSVHFDEIPIRFRKGAHGQLPTNNLVTNGSCVVRERNSLFNAAKISRSNVNNSSIVPLKEAIPLIENPGQAYCLKHRSLDEFYEPGLSRFDRTTARVTPVSKTDNTILPSSRNCENKNENMNTARNFPTQCDVSFCVPKHNNQFFTNHKTNFQSKLPCERPTIPCQNNMDPLENNYFVHGCDKIEESMKDKSGNCHNGSEVGPIGLCQLYSFTKFRHLCPKNSGTKSKPICHLSNCNWPKRSCYRNSDTRSKRLCRDVRSTSWGSCEIRRLSRSAKDLTSLLCRPAAGIHDADFEIRMALPKYHYTPNEHIVCDKNCCKHHIGSKYDAFRLESYGVDQVLASKNILFGDRQSKGTHSGKNNDYRFEICPSAIHNLQGTDTSENSQSQQLNDRADNELGQFYGVVEIANEALADGGYPHISSETAKKTKELSVNSILDLNQCDLAFRSTVQRLDEKNNSNQADITRLKSERSPRRPRVHAGEQYCGTVIRVQGDGRCLFRSLITGLTQKLQIAARDEYGRPSRKEEEAIETHGADDLRHRVVHLMRDNLQFYSELEKGVINADQPRPMNYQKFLDRLEAMEKNTTMPGDMELNAVAMVLERPILVLNSELRKIIIYGEDRFPKMPVLAVRYTRLGADVGHYDTVILDKKCSRKRVAINGPTAMEEGESSYAKKVCTYLNQFINGESNKAGGCKQSCKTATSNRFVGATAMSPKLLAKAEFNFDRDPRLSGRGGGGHTTIGATVAKNCNEGERKRRKRLSKSHLVKSKTNFTMTKSASVKNGLTEKKYNHKTKYIYCHKCGQKIVIKHSGVHQPTLGERRNCQTVNDQREHKRVRLNSDTNENMRQGQKRCRDQLENDHSMHNIDSETVSRPAKRFCHDQCNTQKDPKKENQSKKDTHPRVKVNPRKAKNSKTQDKKMKNKIQQFVNKSNSKADSSVLSPFRGTSHDSISSFVSLGDDKNVRPPKVLNILASSRKKCALCGKTLVTTSQCMVRCYLCGMIAHRGCTTSQGSAWSKEGELYLCSKCMPF